MSDKIFFFFFSYVWFQENKLFKSSFGITQDK